MRSLSRDRGRAATRVGIATVALLSALCFPRPTAAQDEGEPGESPQEVAPRGTSLTSSISADSGVSVQTLCTNCNNADLSISGMGNEHVSVVCDGVPVPSGLAQIYLLSVMPPTRIDKVDVSRGAGDPGYLGAAVGGGIEIERREPQSGFQLNASADTGSYGWNAGRLDLSGKSDWFGGYAVYSTSESDRIDANEDGWTNLPQSDRETLEAGIDMTPGTAHRVRLGANRYVEDQEDGPAAAYSFARRTCEGLDQVIFASEPCTEDIGVGYDRENVQLDRRQYEGLYDLSVGKGTTLSFAGMSGARSQEIQETNDPRSESINLLSDDELDYIEENFGLTAEDLAELGLPIGEPDRTPLFLPAYAIDDRNTHGSISLSKSIGQQSTLRAGGSQTASDFEVIDARLNAQRAEIPGLEYPLDTALEESVIETGYWIEGDTAVGSRLELSAGVRYVDYRYEDNEAEINALMDGRRSQWLELPLPEGTDWVPRAALTWKATDELQLRFSAGQGFRAPAPAFDKVCCGRQYRGNRGVFLEESTSYGFEVMVQPGPRWRLGASAFRADFDNLIINIATQSDQWTHVYQNVNIPRARNDSVSFEARFQAPIWMTTSLSYTWLDPQNLDEEAGITALVDTGGGNPIERTFFYEGIPYTTKERGALGIVFSLPWLVSLNLGTQFTGETRIQSFNTVGEGAGVNPDLTEVGSFWVTNLRVSKALRNGLSFYAGVDNVSDYVQGGGCTGEEALLNPDLVGCLGDPRYDFNWGPLRGRYYYLGIGYTLARPRS